MPSARALPLPAPDFRALFESSPGLYLVLTPDLVISAVSDAYLRATMTQRDEILGRGLFEVFPDNPDDPTATGTSNLRASLERVLQNRVSDVMAVQKYDIRRPESEGGGFEERYWSPVNSPVFGPERELTYIIHRVEDVTEFFRGASSEARYHSLMEHASDAILLLDERGIVEANRQAETLLGRRRAQIVGRRYEEFVAPEEREDAAGRTAQFLAEGKTWIENRNLLRGDGSRVAVDISGALVQVGDETLRLIIIRDITERRRAEEALRASQERLHHLVSSSPAVIYSLRVEGHALVPDWVSDNIEQVLGYARADVATQEWWAERVHPEDQERVLAQVQKLLSEGYVAREYRFRSKDGTYRWVRDEQRLLRDPAGNPVEVVGSWSDVTERKRTEAEHARLSLAVEQAAESIVITDRSGTIVYVNPAFEQVSGYRRAEAIGRTPRILKSGRQGEEFYRELWSTLSRGEVWKGRFINRRKDGTLCEEEATISPVRDAHGEVVNFVSVQRDLTQEQRLEAQLLQSQKMEAIGQLAGGVAHDFNNLLGVITGYTDLLLKDLGTQHPGARRAEQIRKAAERAAGLTRQLLAFSRKQVLEPKVLDLNTVVTDIEKMLRRLIGEDVQLVTVLNEGLGRAKADPGQVEQVIVNLAVNARDAMPTGGKLIIETANVDLDQTYARTHTEVKPGPHVMLAVSDTGHGMDAETTAHIFEPFYTTKEEGKGTGLGLSTVFGIVKQSGGHVSVYSELGRGTTLKVYLPRIDDTGETKAAVPTVAEAPPSGTETILLVEDAEALRVMIREILEAAGHTVLPGGSPEEALAAAEAHSGPIHLVLTDVVMPRMSGPEVAERLKAMRPEVKVLYMSGYTDEAIGHHGALEPGTHFLQKPFTSDALLQKVREVLDAPTTAS